MKLLLDRGRVEKRDLPQDVEVPAYTSGMPRGGRCSKEMILVAMEQKVGTL